MANPESAEKCENCGRVIGRLETPRVHDGHMVCDECMRRLVAASAPTDVSPGLQPEESTPTARQRDGVGVASNSMFPKADGEGVKPGFATGPTITGLGYGLATTAMVFAIIGFLVPLGALLAIICGSIAEKDATDQRIKGRAAMAIFWGVISLTLWLFVVLLLFA